MRNKDIYNIAYRLNMIEDDDKTLCNGDENEPYLSPAERFEETSTADLISVINFVDDLTTYNGLETIKQFLVAVIWENRTKNIPNNHKITYLKSIPSPDGLTVREPVIPELKTKINEIIKEINGDFEGE